MNKHIDAVSTKSKIKSLCRIFYGYMPVKKNTVLFQSFFGMYNDNPRYISEYLHENFPDIEIIWVVSEKNHEILPTYIKKVLYESIAYYKWSYRANVIVDNMAGIRHNEGASNRLKSILKAILRILAPLRKNKQYNISTWHGTPLKRLGLDRFDMVQPKYKRKQGSCDVMLAGCMMTEKALKQAHFKEFSIPFHMYGTPRNDILFDSRLDIIKLKEKLRLPIDKKIILFAPTFRDDSIENSGVLQMSILNFHQLFYCLNEKFGGDWCFVFRVHHTVVTKINTEELSEKYGERIIDGNIGDDMAEYLACADILMTDYSSSMFDFALTKKPCLLFCPDRKHYENDVRGFYFSMDELPFPISYNNESLQDCIETFDQEKYEQDIDAFLEKIGNVEDGHAAERVVEDIKYFLDTGIKR